MRRILLLLAVLALGACQEVLHRDLSARDAAEIVLVLEDAGIRATRQIGDSNRFTVSVAEADAARALDVLARLGLPREEFQSIDTVFPGDSFIITPTEQQARLTFAINQELSRTISDIEGVVSARVHVVIPERTPYRRSERPASASVAVHHLPSVDTAELADKVRLIVSNAVPDLPFRDVSVAFFETTPPGTLLDSMPDMPSRGGLDLTRLVLMGLGGLLALIGLYAVFLRRGAAR
ncbi:MAG: type III secretion inner membrane ring lipoprotein SctJ [Hyphomicrobiaceae bacterium]|nr:type III secretion inner membrane ring lipoprotein SctJ [Hyphomicrobiaceae bacterium]